MTKQPIEVVDIPMARQINHKRVERFKQQITRTIAGEDLSQFHRLVTQYALETDTDLITIAAALAVQANGGRPLFVKDMKIAEPSPRERGQRPGRQSAESSREHQRLRRGQRSQRDGSKRDFSGERGAGRAKVVQRRACSALPTGSGQQ